MRRNYNSNSNNNFHNALSNFENNFQNANHRIGGWSAVEIIRMPVDPDLAMKIAIFFDKAAAHFASGLAPLKTLYNNPRLSPEERKVVKVWVTIRKELVNAIVEQKGIWMKAITRGKNKNMRGQVKVLTNYPLAPLRRGLMPPNTFQIKTAYMNQMAPELQRNISYIKEEYNALSKILRKRSSVIKPVIKPTNTVRTPNARKRNVTKKRSWANKFSLRRLAPFLVSR